MILLFILLLQCQPVFAMTPIQGNLTVGQFQCGPKQIVTGVSQLVTNMGEQTLIQCDTMTHLGSCVTSSIHVNRTVSKLPQCESILEGLQAASWSRTQVNVTCCSVPTPLTVTAMLLNDSTSFTDCDVGLPLVRSKFMDRSLENVTQTESQLTLCHSNKDPSFRRMNGVLRTPLLLTPDAIQCPLNSVLTSVKYPVEGSAFLGKCIELSYKNLTITPSKMICDAGSVIQSFNATSTVCAFFEESLIESYFAPILVPATTTPLIASCLRQGAVLNQLFDLGNSSVTQAVPFYSCAVISTSVPIDNPFSSQSSASLLKVSLILSLFLVISVSFFFL